MGDVNLAVKEIFAIVGGIILVYFLVDLLVFRKQLKRPLYRSRLINVLLVLGIGSVIYVTLKTFTWQLIVQIFLLNTVDLCILMLATTGVVLIFKTSVTTNFAQGMMATFGAFFAATVVIRLSGVAGMSLSTRLFLGLLAGVLISFLLGLFIDVAIIRRGRYVTSVGKQMITMGLVMVLMGLIPVLFGTNPITLPAFSYDVELITIGENFLVIPTQNLYAIAITFAVLALLFAALRFTKWGLGVRATASSEIVASMMGVNTRVITAMSWAIAGGLGAIAAFFFASSTSFRPGLCFSRGLLAAASFTSAVSNAFMVMLHGSCGGRLRSPVRRSGRWSEWRRTRPHHGLPPRMWRQSEAPWRSPGRVRKLAGCGSRGPGAAGPGRRWSVRQLVLRAVKAGK